ncbi:MAG TPA: hypothetical protein VGF75_01920, partial [Candidatus Saccharimonadales bacterium]
NTIIKLVVVILIVLLAFWLGVVYGHHNKANITTAGGFSSSRGNFAGGGFGTVSAVSSTSITVSNQRTNAATTYSITSSTKITDDGQTVSVSSIADGERVIVEPTSSGGTVAGSILVNPSFGGFGGGSSTTNGSSTTGSITTQ